MKKLLSVGLLALFLLTASSGYAQEDKSKRPSPPATVTQTVNDFTITIDYSQPSVKGRTIGKDLEPMDGQVWRTGANEATTFEVNRDVTIEGKSLPKGKYALFSIMNGDEWTIIFNKTWKQWGAFKYQESEDAIRVKAKSGKAEPFAEKMNISITPKGKVTILWGDKKVEFTVK